MEIREILAFPQNYLCKMQSNIYRNRPSSSNPLTINNEYKFIDLIWDKLNGNFIDIIDEQSTLMLIACHGCYNSENEPVTNANDFENQFCRIV